MAITTTAFVTICTNLRRLLKLKLASNRLKSGAAVIKGCEQGKIPGTGAANPMIRDERIRMAGVAKKAKALASARKIDMPKTFVEPYEKGLALQVKKHGASLSHKAVKGGFQALEKETSRSLVEFHNIAAQLDRAASEQKDLEKRVKALKEAWHSYSKAFLSLSVAAGTNPAASGLTPMLWGNMQECADIARHLATVESAVAGSIRVLKSAKEEASDTAYFLGQQLELMDRKTYLEKL